jgi:hypothetical protein
VIHLTPIRVKICLTKPAQAFAHGIAVEPDPSRQLQEKAGGVTPAGRFSLEGEGAAPDSIFKKSIRHREPSGRANAPPMTGSAQQSIER